ncbi:MAG: hypothetical protein AB7L09_03155 [Nitrospira sp.]
MTINEKTGLLTYNPPWPPAPSEHDLWVKKTKYALLEREVVAVKGINVSYKDQNGDLKICSREAFWRWCDDSRAQPKRLANYTITEKDGETKIKYVPRKRKKN